MKIQKDEVIKRLIENDNILIICHMSPDGDTLGCAYALYNALVSKNKNVRVDCSDEVPERFEYLQSGYVNSDFEPEYVIAVDLAARQLIGEKLSGYVDKIDLCIDHHPSNELYAKETYLVSTAAAACEIIYDIIVSMKVDITTEIATCLYTGIATDTGCFCFSNTTSNTHYVAAELYKIPAEYEHINALLFNTKSKSRLRIEQKVLNTMEYFYNDKVAISCITQKMIEESKADESELDGVSNIPRSIEGVEIGITMREKLDGNFKVSVRTTSKADASKICGKFNGGGHKRAAGCLIEEDYQTAKALLVKAVKEFIL